MQSFVISRRALDPHRLALRLRGVSGQKGAPDRSSRVNIGGILITSLPDCQHKGVLYSSVTTFPHLLPVQDGLVILLKGGRAGLRTREVIAKQSS